MIMKKLKGLQIVFMFMMMLSLVACSSTPKYDDVIGYWKSTDKKDMMTGDAQICVFQKEYILIGSNKVEYVIDADADELTLKLPTYKTKIVITEYDGDSMKISLPQDEEFNGDRTYFTYVPISKEEFEKTNDEEQKKSEKRLQPIDDPF